MGGEASDSAYWQAAIEHFHWDRMEESAQLVADRGVGDAGSMLRWLRAIEAEAVTRRRSVTQRLTDWLEFETIPSEAMGQEEAMATWVLESVDEIANPRLRTGNHLKRWSLLIRSGEGRL